jgi:hypothetical protein
VGKKSRIYSNFEAISRNLPEYKNKALKKLMIFSDNKAFKNIHAKLLGDRYEVCFLFELVIKSYCCTQPKGVEYEMIFLVWAVNIKLHYYAPREKLIEKAYTNLVGENPDEGGHYFTV